MENENITIEVINLLLNLNLSYKKVNQILFNANELNLKLTEIKNLSPKDLIFHFPLLNINDCQNILANIKTYETDKLIYLIDKYTPHIRLITTLDENYPKKIIQQLKLSSPPILFYYGNLEITNKESVGIIGSRKADVKNKILSYQISKELASQNKNIVSGYADGIDINAHIGALDGFGSTTFVLPFDIYLLNKKGLKIDKEIDEQDNLIISEFIPKNYQLKNAPLIRNRIISALSDVIIAIECRKHSGTLNTLKHSVKDGKAVIVINSAEDENYIRKFLTTKNIFFENTKDVEEILNLLNNKIQILRVF